MSIVKCVICDRSIEDAALKPFCSKRCQDIDLGRWASGAYAVPSAEPLLDEQGLGDQALEDVFHHDQEV